MEKEKTCTGCENQNEEHSIGWGMAKILSKTIKRQTITIFVILALWFVSIVASVGTFVWYLNQYDVSSYEVQQDGEWGNTFIDGGNEGDISYGAEDIGSETDTQK